MNQQRSCVTPVMLKMLKCSSGIVLIAHFIQHTKIFFFCYSSETQWRRPFFFFFFFCFSLLKTTKICFGSTKMGILPGKKHFTLGKSGKMTLPPQKNMPVTPLVKLKSHQKYLNHTEQFQCYSLLLILGFSALL